MNSFRAGRGALFQYRDVANHRRTLAILFFTLPGPTVPREKSSATALASFVALTATRHCGPKPSAIYPSYCTHKVLTYMESSKLESMPCKVFVFNGFRVSQIPESARVPFGP
eukprot:1902266-Amphidinium_carterae.1